jgi:NaMN:DMB phosphoribosyltransferase
MVLPLPDDAAASAARDRLASVDIGISAPTVTALGMMAEAVVYIAGVQGSAYPRPLLSTRVVLLTGSHAGGLVAGPTPDPRNGLPLQHLAVTAGAGVVTLEWQPAAAAIELEDAITPEQMDAALRAGWDEAERAADEGIELLVLAAGGAGAATAAAAVVAAATGAEPTTLLGRVVTPAGFYDDNAWMTRCLALRDALHRVRHRHGDPRTVLAALGGADIAAATGLILGAANRKTPVMIDGPVGAAAALLANDFSVQSRGWVMLPDTGRQMTVRFAAEALGLRPWLDLCLDLGEGATALAALPMLQTALTLAGVGEQVEPTPMSRFDSTGNQIFVGVARPVEPTVTEDEPIDAESELVLEPSADDETLTVLGTPSVDDTAFVVYAARGGSTAKDEPATRSGAKAASKPEPAKAETKAEPTKATGAKATSRTVSGKTAAHKQVPAKSAAKSGPTRLAKSTQLAKAAPDRAGPDKVSADKVSADKSSADKSSADKASPDKTSPDKTSPDKTSPDKTGLDKATPDETSADAASEGKAGPAKAAPVGEASGDSAKDTRDASVTVATDAKATDTVAKDRPVNDRLAKDRLANDRPAKDRLANDRLAAKDSDAKDGAANGNGSRPERAESAGDAEPSDRAESAGAEKVGAQPVAVAVGSGSASGSASQAGSPPRPRKRA